MQQGSLVPTVIEVDTQGLVPLREALRVLTQSDEVIDTAAARVLAAELLDRHRTLVARVKLVGRPGSARTAPHEAEGTRLAVVPQPMTLSPDVLDYVTACAQVEPSAWQGFGDTLRDHGEPLRGIVIRDLLGQLRTKLLDPDLPDDAPLRRALTAADTIVTRWTHAADRTFALTDRPPHVTTYSAETPHMRRYLADFTVVAVERLPRHLIRRGRELVRSVTESTFAARRMDITVRHHVGLDLLAVTYTEKPWDEVATLQTLGLELQTPTDRVELEWPAQTQPVGLDLIRPGDRLVAPPAIPDVYRPVFLQHPDGSLTPVPTSTSYGPGWGVSGTDQLTPAIDSWLTDQGPGYRYIKGVEDVTGRDLYEWLQRTLMASHSGILAVDAHEIAARYAEWLATISSLAPGSRPEHP
jgi:hypothetical protein